MPARSKARKRALDLLYEAEIRGEDVLRLLSERAAGSEPPVPEYAAVLVRGVQAHRAEIDGMLAEYSRGWSLDRMPAVDRNILRIGTYELFWAGDVPPGVAISEAVLLARLADLRPAAGDDPGGGAEPGGEAGADGEPGPEA